MECLKIIQQFFTSLITYQESINKKTTKLASFYLA